MLLRININGKRTSNRLMLIHLLKVRGIPYASETDSSIIVNIPSTTPIDRNGITWIDMKPFFQLSARAKPNKTKPGWHEIIPIQPGISQLRHDLSPISQQRLAELSPGETTNIADLSNLIPHLTNSNDYTNQITEASNDSVPTMFRTVSNNSKPNSWITIDREKNTDYQQVTSGDIKTVNLDDTPDAIIDNNNENLANEANPLIGSSNILNDQLNNLINDPNIPSQNINKLNDRNTPDFYNPVQLNLF